MPELEFFYDKSVAQQDRIEQILQDLKAEARRPAAAPPAATMPPTSPDERRPQRLAEICDAIHARQRFLITSHARPDGDSIGSQLAMAYALEALGKEVRIVNADPAPEHYMEFPGIDRIEIARARRADRRRRGDRDGVAAT